MRFARGNGYELFLFNGRTTLDSFFPTGLVMPISGIGVDVGETYVPVGWSAEIIGRVRVRAKEGTVLAVALENSEGMPNAPGRFFVSPVVRHEKNWGFELEAPTTRKNIQLKYLEVADGHRTSLQYHEHKDECILFIHGGPEAPFYVPPMQIHRVTGPKTYVEASTHFPDDVQRVEDDYGRPTIGTSDVTP